MVTTVVYSGPAVEPVSISDVVDYCHIDNTNQEPAPGAITVALGSGAGNVDNGAHRYLCTFLTLDGETQAGERSAPVTVLNKAVNGKIQLTTIPLGGSLVTGRKLYRTAAGGIDYLYLATISDNTTEIYTDNIADSSLGASAPLVNTTGDATLRLLIRSARIYAEKRLGRYLITQTIDHYLDRFPDRDEEILLCPIQSVASISYIDQAGELKILDPALYIVDTVSAPGRILPAYGSTWPPTRDPQFNAVKIRAIAGYGGPEDVPETIRQWILLRIKQAYDNRGTINIGNIVNEFPYAQVDGLLDDEKVWGL